MNNYNQALLDFTKLLMLKNTAENYINRARIFLEMNDNKNVLIDLFKAIKLDDNSYDAYYNRALVYHDKLEYDSAISDLQRCMEIRPDNDDAKEKLAFLQKIKEIKNDSLNDNQHEFQNITESWKDDFRDTQIHIVHHKKIDSNILVAEKIKNDNEIKRDLNHSVSRINNNEQTPEPDITISEKSNNKGIPVENQKQNEKNNLLTSNKTNDNNSTLQNINKGSSAVNKDQTGLDNVLASNIVVNNSASQNNIKIDLPISSIDRTEQTSVETQPADKKDVKKLNDVNLVIKQDDNSNIDFITNNNTTGKKNIKTDLQVSSSDNTGRQIAEKIGISKISYEINQDNSQKNNDQPVEKDTKEISKSDIANESNPIQKSNKHYTIQLGAFESEKNAMEFEQNVKSIIDYEIKTYESSGLFKIRTGDYQLKEALLVIKKIRQSGFTDAIIVESEN